MMSSADQVDRDGEPTAAVLASATVPSSGEDIYYEVARPRHVDSQPETIVFCHGAGGCHASWFQQVPYFARQHQVITWDQRGFGSSTNRTGQATPANAIEDLMRILDVTGVSNAHIVGQSLGGWAAMGLALNAPERVTSVVLSDSIGGLFNDNLEKAFDGFIQQSALASEPSPVGRHLALGQVLTREDPIRAFLYQQIASLSRNSPPDAVPLIRQTYVSGGDVAAMQVPLAAIVGESDQIFPPADVQAVLSCRPSSQVTVIPDAGHSAYFEQPDLFNAALEASLKGQVRSPSL